MNNPKSNLYAIGLTILSVLGRLIPHWPNVTPVGGASLFAGSRVAGFWAYLLPLAVMALTDPFVGGFNRLTPVIYGCFLLNVFLGRRLLRKVTAVRVGATAFLCSLQFFLISNFGIWAIAATRGSHYYSADLAGLLQCYSMALPFWGRTLAGDLLYSGAIFGLYALLVRAANRNSANVVTPSLLSERHGEQRA